MIERTLHGHTIYLREDSSDIGTWDDVFVHGYHREPEGLLPRLILDLGAYTGLTSIDFTLRNPDAKIIAVELDQDNYNLLVKNTQTFLNIIPVHSAVAGEIGQRAYTPHQYANAHALTETGNTKVMSRTIRHLLEANRTFSADFVKVDIEGAEKEVLENINDWKYSVDCLNIEIHDPDYYNLAKLVLKSAGYLICKNNHPSGLIAIKHPDEIRYTG